MEYFAHKSIRHFGGTFKTHETLTVKYQNTQVYTEVIRMDTKIDYLLVFMKLKWLNRRIKA